MRFYLVLVLFVGGSHAFLNPAKVSLNAIYKILDSVKNKEPTALAFNAVKDAVNWNSMLVLDVRHLHDILNQGKIPRSHSVPFDKLSDALDLSERNFLAQYGFPKPSKQTNRLLVLGDSVEMGRAAIKKLRSMGYWKAKWYPGGFREWARMGGKIEKDLPSAVGFDELNQGLRSRRMVLIDIRLPLELEMFGIIPGSINIPVTEIPTIFEAPDEEFERKLGFRKPPRVSEQTLVLLGTEGTSAEESAEALQKLGYRNLKIYPGGFQDWKDRRGTIVYPKPQEVTYADMREALQNNNIIVMDVRQPQEVRTKGKIPGSHNVPLLDLPLAFLEEPEDFKRKYGFDLPEIPGSNIIITGGSSNRRGRQALKRLRTLGYTRIKLYDGSFSDWVANGGELLLENVVVTTTTPAAPPYSIVS